MINAGLPPGTHVLLDNVVFRPVCSQQFCTAGRVCQGVSRGFWPNADGFGSCDPNYGLRIVQNALNKILQHGEYIYIYTTYTTWKVDGNSHVLVYHGPLLIHLLGVASHAIYFHHGVYTYIYIYIWYPPPKTHIFSKFTGICAVLLLFTMFKCFFFFCVYFIFSKSCVES